MDLRTLPQKQLNEKGDSLASDGQTISNLVTPVSYA